MVACTKYGKFEGIKENQSIVFKGIPYAKAPVGELRWKAPQEPECFEGIFKADRFAPKSMQKGPQMPPQDGIAGYDVEFYDDPAWDPGMSEDCLYLNIWVPEEGGENLPVAFWIHGGGFGGGYSSEKEFSGEAYNRKGVIMVTIEYRCGFFGFLAHPLLDAENEKSISGNYGILDQIAALKWVYENIAAFGGDPNNITVHGQSAGCMSTQVLISSPLTEGMIAKAILQSGIEIGGGVLYTPTLQQEEEIGQWFVDLTGCSSAEELRALPAEKILDYNMQIMLRCFREGLGLAIVPNVDGYVLPQSVVECFKNGQERAIPYMAGAVENDLAVTPEMLENGTPGPLYQANIDFCIETSKRSGHKNYCYYFTRHLPGDQWGAFHSAELWYMQGTLDRCWRPMTDADHALSEKMVTYWTNFMKTGDPNGEDVPEWKPCTEADPQVVVLDVE
ncbi:MAG: carboxylesterase family protein [Eubacteriales bacterium]|nr:carboxylesterase family protein [Eubacteriales bacterium]